MCCLGNTLNQKQQKFERKCEELNKTRKQHKLAEKQRVAETKAIITKRNQQLNKLAHEKTGVQIKLNSLKMKNDAILRQLDELFRAHEDGGVPAGGNGEQAKRIII